MPLLLSPVDEPADLSDRFGRLRRRSRGQVVARSITALAAGCLAYVLLIGALDWTVELPAIVRAVLLVAALIGAGWIVLRSLITPWADAGNDLSLALRIERRFPKLNDALASAIEFDRSSGHGSSALRAATRQNAVREMADCDLDALVDYRSPIRRSAVCVLLTIVALGLIINAPSRCSISLARIADPFGEHPWPPDTIMTVTAPEWLARGDPFILRGELSGVVPDRAELEVATESAPNQTLVLPVTEREAGGTFGIRLEPNRVSNGFRYRVRAHDAATPWRTVAVFVPPELADRDGRSSPQVQLSFPKYSQKAPVDLPDGGCNIQGVTGVVARIRAAVDRPIARAEIALPLNSPIRAATALTAMGAVHPADALAALVNGLAVTNPAVGEVAADGMGFNLLFTPPISGRFVLQFEDHSELVGRREFEVRLEPDPSPIVQLERPAASRESLSVLPNATIALAARVEDPVFAVRSAWLEYRTSADTAWRRKPLIEPTKNGSPSVQIQEAWELATIAHADGRPLQDGDVVTLAIAADDFDDVTTAKPPGRSHQVELRIVSPVGLRGIAQKSQAEIQRELAALQSLQRSAREKTDAANEQRRKSGSLQQADIDRLAESAQIQQQIRRRVGNEREGLRASVEQLRQTLRNNTLSGSTAERERADLISTELDRLLREELEPIEPLLAAARTEPGAASPDERRSGPLPLANRLQRDAERTLQELSERMQAWSEARELRAEAGLLERDQERLMRQREQLENRLDLRGAEAEKLSAEQRDALSRLADRQSSLAERGKELANKLHQRAADKRANQQQKHSVADPQPKPEDELDATRLLDRQAQSLEKARDLAQESPSLSAQLNDAGQSIASNKLGEAKSAQAAAIEKLRQIQDALAESPERDIDRLAKRLAEAERDIDEMLNDQERLQKRAAEIQSLTDPATKKPAVDQLAREQETLRQRTDELAQRLRRLNQDSAAQDLRRAMRSMDQAREALEHGEPSGEKQDQALDRLEDAQMQVERERANLQEELQREQWTRLLDALKGFAARQDALNSESERVFQAAKSDQSWSRALQKGLIDLGQAESALGVELGRFADEKFKEAKIVAHLLRETVQAMNGVGPAIEAVRNGSMDLESWDGDRRQVQDPQQMASRRLQQLLDTIRDSEKEQREQTVRTQQDKQSGERGPSAPGDGISPTVQLRILRALQAELNDQTVRFAQEHPDPEKWNAADRADLARLERLQAELAALLESLTAAEPLKEDKK